MIETKIIYQDVSPDGKLIATYSGVNIAPYSDYADILNNAYNVTEEYTSLELNMWGLDGTQRLFPEDTTHTVWGFVSETLSEEDTFYTEETAPQLIVDYTAAQDSVALTLDFDVIRSQYPTNVRITYFQNDLVLDDSVYSCNYAEGFCFPKEVKGYNRIVIKFLSTKLPKMRIRFINIYFGILRTFINDELEKVNAVEELNPLSTELSINTMDFTVRNTSDIPFLFQKMQPINLSYGGNHIGTYYIDDSKRSAKNLYDVSCIDNIGILDRNTFMGGLYQNKLATEVIAEIMANTRIEYSVDSSLSQATISGYIPICTKREALLLVCFAIGAVADTSRTSLIRIYTLNNELKHRYDEEETYMSGSVTSNGKVTAVTLKAYVYTLSDKAEELFKAVLIPGEHTITFDSPCYGYSVTGATILEKHVNYVKISVPTSAEVVLTGSKYNETALEYTKENPGTKLTDVQNIVTSDKCKLVNTENVNQLLDRLYDYSMQNQNISTKLVINENTSVGDMVELLTAYDEYVKCRLTRVKLSFGLTHMTGEIEGVIDD